MSVSGSRAAVEINLEEFERRLRAAGTQPPGQNDPLFELARLVESSKRAGEGAASPPRASTQLQPLATVALPTELEETPAEGDEIFETALEEANYAHEFHESGVAEAELRGRRSGRWKIAVSALAAAGVAMMGAVVFVKGGVPGMPKHPPFIAAALGPTKVLPPSDVTAASSDAVANLLKDNTQSARAKVVATEEQPVDLSTLSSLKAPPPAASSAPSEAAAAPGVRATVDTPVVVATPAPAPPAASQFPDPKPVRTVYLRPDGTPIPSTLVASADPSVSAPAVEASKPPGKPASKGTADSAANAQPSTPKLELPTKLRGKSSARVVVGKTDTTAPSSIAEAANEPLQLGTPAKAAKAAKTQQAALEPPAPQTPAQPTVDSTVATKSTGWAVQLAAPNSESEAKTDMARLNAKYASALNGSSIGVHKAVVKGEAIYRLRVVGLSKADAAALCARLKGDGGQCFIAK